MEAKDLITATGKMLVIRGHNPVCANVIPFGSYEMDVISMSGSGYMYEFEIKISRSDFKAEKHKVAKHQNHGISFKNKKPEAIGKMEHTSANYFSFVVPKGMVVPDEIPEYAGLYYFIDSEKDLFEIRKPKRIHKLMHKEHTILTKVARVNSQRQFLGSCLLTFKNKQNKILNAERTNERKGVSGFFEKQKAGKAVEVQQHDNPERCRSISFEKGISPIPYIAR